MKEEKVNDRVEEIARECASTICNAFATMYFDVHATAGPWGAHHVDDVSSVISQAISSAIEESQKERGIVIPLSDHQQVEGILRSEISRLAAENEELKKELEILGDTHQNADRLALERGLELSSVRKELSDLRAKVEKMEKALGKCVTSLDGLYTFHRHSPVWNTLHTTEALEEGKQALSHLTGEKKT